MKMTADIIQKHTLVNLSFRYCEATWQAWKDAKSKAIANVADPMLGGPEEAIAKGIADVTNPDGSTITLTRLSRIRLRDLNDASAKHLGDAFGKDLLAIKAALGDKGLGKDVLHQEFVPTFAENIKNDRKHLLNNFVAVSAVLDTVMSFFATGDTTVEKLITTLENITETPLLARMISIAVRASWLGRAAQDGSWDSSSDFVWYSTLSKDVAEIDPYVALPTLKMLVSDLREGRI